MLRHFLVSAFAFLLLMGSLPANAAEAEVRAYVDKIGKQVISVIDGAGSEDQKHQQLQKMFTEQVDTEWMGKFVLGHAWQKATTEQRSQYLAAYRKYLLAHYTSRFADYTGANYEITGVKAESAGQYTVNMRIKSAEQEQATRAGYRLRPEGNGYKIIDIIVEGISQITTQRSEFTSVVQQKGVAGLIEAIEQKIAAAPE